MTVTEVVIPLLQAVHAGITGVNTAPLTDAAFPSKLLSDKAPYVLTFPGEGETQAVRPGLHQDNRFWVVEYYYAPVVQGANIHKVRTQASILKDRIAETWMLKGDDETYMLDYGLTSGYRVEFKKNDRIRDIGITSQMVYDSENIKWWGTIFYLPISAQWGDAV